MNFPKFVYFITDCLLRPIVWLLVPQGKIAARLRFEESQSKMDEFEYTSHLLGLVHDRASTMVSHLSIMLALCLFFLSQTPLIKSPTLIWVVRIDATIYILLVIFCIRCLRTIGIDKDYLTRDALIAHFRSEVRYKFCIIEVVNTVAITATVVLAVALVLGLWVK